MTTQAIAAEEDGIGLRLVRFAVTEPERSLLIDADRLPGVIAYLSGLAGDLLEDLAYATGQDVEVLLDRLECLGLARLT